MAAKKRTVTPNVEGLAGFYRAYTSKQAATMDEAIELAKRQAASFGMTHIVVVKEQCNKTALGTWFVSLRGKYERRSR